MARFESGFTPREGEHVFCECRVDDVATGCCDSIKRFFTCKKGTSFVIVTDQRFVAIDKARICCCVDFKTEFLNPSHILRWGYTSNRCMCCGSTSFFFVTASGERHSFCVSGKFDDKETGERVCLAVEALIKQCEVEVAAK